MYQDVLTGYEHLRQQHGAVQEPRWAVQVNASDPVRGFEQKIDGSIREWPFELDTFQKQAILKVEDGQNVFVAAHTSAGKTVVAEYAIGLTLSHSMRAVYTSPVKALSNQKFRDFKEIFDDVGLITGDTQVNEDASCLIMTTEILRSRLYQGSEMLQDLEWVIMDEVHYINDVERGVVWEEVIIMLPDHVKLLLLSATVPNALELAEWIGNIKQKPIYVVSTSQRPVPLRHYLYTLAPNRFSNGLQLLMDEHGRFLEQGYATAKQNLVAMSQGSSFNDNHRSSSVAINSLNMLRTDNKLPAIVFVFSKKKIETNCENTDGLDLTSPQEKAEIETFFQESLANFKEADQNLPQIQKLKRLLRRGFGVHHAGILPVLKEIVEMLFQRALPQILFATETLSMGVNLPAKTVVFDGVWKNDGRQFRFVQVGEYTQMAGRAGRRGMDMAGNVIILCHMFMPKMSNLRKALQGNPNLLRSKFRLTYSMILHLMRDQQFDVQDMMRKSFNEFHTKQETARYLEDIKRSLSLLRRIDCPHCNTDLARYYDRCSELNQLRLEFMSKLLSHPSDHAPNYCHAPDDSVTSQSKLLSHPFGHPLMILLPPQSKLLSHPSGHAPPMILLPPQSKLLSHPSGHALMTPGRIVLVKRPGDRLVLGVVLKSSLSDKFEQTYFTLFNCEASDASAPEDVGIYPERPYTPVVPQLQRSFMALHLKAKDVALVSTSSINIKADLIIRNLEYDQKSEVRIHKCINETLDILLQLTRRNSGNFRSVHQERHELVSDPALAGSSRSIDLLVSDLRFNYSCTRCPQFQLHFKDHNHNKYILNKHQELTVLASEDYQPLLPDYNKMVQVLKELKYINASDEIQMKGVIACKLNTHELVITEVVVEDFLTQLQAAEVAALLSCFVFESSRCKEPNLTATLANGKNRILNIAETVGECQRNAGMLMPVEVFKEQLHFGLVEVVYRWAQGESFSVVKNLTDVDEGVIVRTLQTLNELLGRVERMGSLLNRKLLSEKCMEAMNLIHRDLVVTPSLYVQDALEGEEEQ
ncbi:uncharacterized protein LOC131937492 [Physella acuta]|uniref:uncharacterized protein LOC131937492 n=1 Tax=Physella acuta TaxID=109671 RepID=UPI0027DC0C72|nr:uncharacterized protein LOC131937492 [Physella acuta]